MASVASLCIHCLLLLIAVNVTHAQIRILSPRSLAQQFGKTHGKIQGATGMFGAPFYGDRIMGRLAWGDHRGHYHCNDTDYILPDLDVVHHAKGSSHDQVRLIDIVMVRRGECSFVTKVRVASAKGAHAVVIVDREDSPLTSHELENIIVADDGYGSKISIPSVLISHFDGDKLIQAARQGEVVVELAWEIPTGQTVAVDMWMSSGSQESQKFLKEFSENRKTLNEVVKFTPHYHVFSASTETGAYTGGLCLDDTAKYCAEDPDASGQITGKDVLEEDVRQLCLHLKTRVPRYRHGEKTVAPVFYAEKWWNYMTQFSDRCPLDGTDPEGRFGETCSYKLMRDLGIDDKEIRSCYNRHKEDMLESERINKGWSPRALRVNGWRYSGIIDAELVTRAVCSGFIKQPEECASLLKPRDPTVKYLQAKEAGVSSGSLVAGLAGVLVLLGCVMFLYRKYLNNGLHARIREEVMLEVNTRMEEYRKLPQ